VLRTAPEPFEDRGHAVGGSARDERAINMTGIPLNGRVKNHAKGEFSTGIWKKIQ
jgi:hypothetical protein